MVEPVEQARTRTALVLDDEVQIGTVVCKALTAVGISTSHFTDPLHFLLEVKRSAPDIVILDLALGRSDAVDVIRKLDVLRFPGSVLLISGRDEATLGEIERIGRTHGLAMLPSLQKPFRIDQLRARLQSPLSGRCEPTARPKSKIAGPAPLSPRATLAQALERNFLEVWYQPKVDLRSLAVCGAEALIRARHPQRGVLPPEDILPPPGDPLLKPLTLFVIRKVISDWAVFAARGNSMKLSVNVPASILSAPGFVDFVRNTLPADPAFPGLIVEVTEDEVIRDMSWIHEAATQLGIYNVSISIDDFGSGYAPLSRLKDLPFREIKLDHGFVANCAKDSLKRSLCQTVVDLAHCFKASACAEGIETVEELRCLIDLGFDTAQGFIFAKPMPCNQFLEFVAGPQSAASGAVSSVAPRSAQA